MPVLDWNFEAEIDYTIMNANLEYLVSTLEAAFRSLYPANTKADPGASAFLSALRLGSLPLANVRNHQTELIRPASCADFLQHPFIAGLNDPSILKDSCQFAQRRKTVS